MTCTRGAGTLKPFLIQVQKLKNATLKLMTHSGKYLQSVKNCMIPLYSVWSFHSHPKRQQSASAIMHSQGKNMKSS